ncbi:unnamed protein product [Polarella glacialis]|uniref:Nucleotide-diphospho-sugar transferase domain-containing protein n=1 Tax=Polarella glacialis TaxID=89957 RepID=A0A813DEI7_POLGL|nr:unnamed protein product [Polarella glacialis]
MLQNWECSAQKLGLDWVVIAMDTKLYSHLGPERSILVEGEQVEGSSRFGTGDFAVIACNKIRTITSILKHTKLDLVFTDCDNVFKSDPFLPSLTLGSLMRSNAYEYVYVRKSKPPGSIWSEYHTEPDKANTGFYYVAGSRKSAGVQHAFDAGVNFCNIHKRQDDQESFWDALVQLRKGQSKDAAAFSASDIAGPIMRPCARATMSQLYLITST